MYEYEVWKEYCDVRECNCFYAFRMDREEPSERFMASATYCGQFQGNSESEAIQLAKAN